LQVQSNTVITNLGKYNPLILSEEEPESVEFCDAINKSTRIGKFYIFDYSDTYITYFEVIVLHINE